MIYGLGNDIIEIERISKAIKRHGIRFLDKVFTPTEQTYCLKHNQSERHFAGRFAAKEAILKALGTGLQGASWLDIEIVNDHLGKPCAFLSKNLQQNYNDWNELELHVSISHCKTFASAVAVLATK